MSLSLVGDLVAVFGAGQCLAIGLAAVAEGCRVMGVARSSFYDAAGSRPSCVDGLFAARGIDVGDDGSGASMCPACLRGPRPLALMKSADRIPNQRVAPEALDGRQVVPIPGLTGSSSTLITLGLGPELRVLAADLVKQPRQGPGLHSPVRVSASPTRCARSCSPAPPIRPELAYAQATWSPRACWTFPCGLPE